MAARLFTYGFLGAFTLASVLLLGISIGTAVQRATLIIAGARATATVVAKRESPQTKNGQRMVAPVVQFTAGDGRTYVVTSDVSGPESQYQFGQPLPVLYVHDHPDGARIDAFAPLWMLPLVAGVVGAAFSVVPAIVFTSWRRRRRLAAGVALADEVDGTASRGLRRVLGAALTVGGLALAAVSLASPETAAGGSAREAQVLGSCVGLMLAASGVQVGQWVTQGSRLHHALGALVVTSFSVVFGWVSLFGEASGFSGGASVGSVAVGIRGGVTAARLAFGAFALLTGAAALWSWKQVLRRRE